MSRNYTPTLYSLAHYQPRINTTYQLTTTTLALLVTAYFVAAFNYPVIATIATTHGLHQPKDYFFMVTVVIFLVTLINLIVSLLAFKHSFKPWLITLLMGAAVTSYFMNTYHIVIDRSMIQNVMETDYQESVDLFSWELALQTMLLGVIPGIIVTQLPIRYDSFIKEVGNKLVIALLSFLSIGLVAFVFYQDYASLLRNNRHVRDQIIPLDYVYASYSYAKDKLTILPTKIKLTGEDAHLGPAWGKSSKKVVTVIVVGETARAANFSLNGYARETNPHLKKQDTVYYNNFHSCGTATATSVPCMFSNLGRKNYAEMKAKHSENLLDVISHAGIPVLWRDNNSGCKGVCDRVDYDDVSHLAVDTVCNSDECFDMILLHQLQEKIAAYNDTDSKGIVIVLHQKGSHGPDYYKRTPDEFQAFQPPCRTNRMIECTRAEITNAYDNTILYTDHVLSSMIDFLKTNAGEYDSSLLYISDHGESLGENNLYLHGIPYSIAPEQQTHIPALFWMSDSFAKRFNLNKECLIQHSSANYSHDNLFHSVLGMLDINTDVYNPALDIFSICTRR